MYRIGDFSRISRLTVKALHYYEDEGLLVPSARSESGYRLYSGDDLPRAELIRHLRDLDFSIREIREVIALDPDGSDLRGFLTEKRSHVQSSIDRQRDLIAQIDATLANLSSEPRIPQAYQFELRDIPQLTVFSRRFHGAYADVGTHIDALFGIASPHATGAPFCLYHDREYTEVADIQVCIPVANVPRHLNDSVDTLPAMHALVTFHRGSYDRLSDAYRAMIDEISSKHLEVTGPMREVYLKAPGTIFHGNAENYVTELQFPVKGREDDHRD